MKHNVIVTVTSLLSILLFSIHVTDDIVRGFDSWGPQSLFWTLFSLGATGTLSVILAARALRSRQLGSTAAQQVESEEARRTAHQGVTHG